MKTTHNFMPSKRAFQVQFKRWDFPSKQNPAHRNAELVARVKELWEQNYTQREMLATLTDEGYELKERELMRLRGKHRWLLRVPNGMKDKVDAMNLDPEKMTIEQFDSLQAQLESAAGLATITPRKVGLIPDPLPEDEIKKRKQRHEELLEDSEKRMSEKKRRRRTKQWAGLPADPEGLPPRFPSETTLEESKTFLEMSNEEYKAMRDQFQGICESVGVMKKTTCGAEKWSAVKDQLVRDNEPLQRVFWNETIYPKDSKTLALDVICTDVTKRMRVMETRMTIADAKNTLSINPEQSRQIRNAFYNILKADHFESKLAAGDAHWNKLKAEWIAGQPILQQILAPGPADPMHAKKEKALEVLCRDVMKRLRDDHIRTRSGGKRYSNVNVNNDSTLKLQPSPEPDSQPVSPAARRTAPAAAVAAAATQLADSSLGLSNLDPNLLGDPVAPASSEPPAFGALPPFLRHQPTSSTSATYPAPTHAPPISIPTSNPTPIYIRPHISSSLPPGVPTKMFLASLSAPTLSALITLVSDHWQGVDISRVDGVEKVDGREMKYLIEEDEELEAYLAHTEGRKSAFSVVLRARGGDC
jgi:hypothetical protein